MSGIGSQVSGDEVTPPGPSRHPIPDTRHLRETAVEAARAAGRLLRERIDSIRVIRHKGVVDLVTDVDVQSEQLVRQTILRAFPTHTIVGEEGGSVAGSDPRVRWFVDPLDGTTNYAHGLPIYCVSIGVVVDGEPVVGVVYDPTQDELFLAERGQGATLNGSPIQVSEVADLQQALLATGFPYDRRLFARALRGFELLALRGQAVRRIGSAALDLCYVACGRFDAYWEFFVQPWDVAAGLLLVREAGGLVTKLDAAPFDVGDQSIVSSNAALHPALLEALALVDERPS